MTLSRKFLAILTTSLALGTAHAATTVTMNAVDANGNTKSIGTVTFTKAKWGGLLVQPNLRDLTPGEHGFHIHQHPSCDDKAMAAGGHYDPKQTEQHKGPYDDSGHLGDLPVLNVNKNGTATLPSLAPRLTMADLKGHALMIHMDGDNYSDQPKKLGGGGARVACGVILK